MHKVGSRAQGPAAIVEDGAQFACVANPTSLTRPTPHPPTRPPRASCPQRAAHALAHSATSMRLTRPSASKQGRQPPASELM